MAKADQRASQQDGPKEPRLVQVLCYAKLLHIILAQGLLHQRVQDLQQKSLSVTHQEMVTHIISRVRPLMGARLARAEQRVSREEAAFTCMSHRHRTTMLWQICASEIRYERHAPRRGTRASKTAAQRSQTTMSNSATPAPPAQMPTLSPISGIVVMSAGSCALVLQGVRWIVLVLQECRHGFLLS